MSIAVSSWALHRTIGTSYPDSPAAGPQPPTRHSQTCLDLLDLPKALAEHGFNQMQLCHFHLPSRELDYAERLQDALKEAGVQLITLLIDEGDVSQPEHGTRDTDWIAGWIDTAAQLGAKRARVIAGKQPYSAAAIERSVRNLEGLVTQTDVKLEIENWHNLTATPEAVNQILGALEGRLGLCADFGNWPSPWKYQALPQIMSRAETIHAKCDFVDGLSIDRNDYDACLQIARQANFSGPYVLVNGGPADEWDALRVSSEYIGRDQAASANPKL